MNCMFIINLSINKMFMCNIPSSTKTPFIMNKRLITTTVVKNTNVSILALPAGRKHNQLDIIPNYLHKATFINKEYERVEMLEGGYGSTHELEFDCYRQEHNRD